MLIRNKNMEQQQSDPTVTSPRIGERVAAERLSVELLESIKAQLRELPRHKWDAYLWRAGNEFVSVLARARHRKANQAR